jgi:hypothetical protein
MAKLEQVAHFFTKAKFVPHMGFTTVVFGVVTGLAALQLAVWEHGTIAHQGVSCVMGEREIGSERVIIRATCVSHEGVSFRARVQDPALMVAVIEGGITNARCDATHSASLRNCTPM